MQTTQNTCLYPYLCIQAAGAGTRIDAVYMAVARFPYNVQILETVKQGLPDCVIMDRRTPVDVVDFVVEHFNSFHAGSPTTFLQWRAHTHTHMTKTAKWNKWESRANNETLL